MKYVISFFLLVSWLFYASGCKEDDTMPQTELEKLPSMTQTGENTFGCLVNGEAWVPRTTIDANAVYQQGFLSIGANIEERGREQNIIIWLDENNIKPIGYILNSESSNKASLYDQVLNCDYESFSPESGQLVIFFIDWDKYIIAGKFEFTAISADCQDTVYVTDGRFDLNFIP